MYRYYALYFGFNYFNKNAIKNINQNIYVIITRKLFFVF